MLQGDGPDNHRCAGKSSPPEMSDVLSEVGPLRSGFCSIQAESVHGIHRTKRFGEDFRILGVVRLSTPDGLCSSRRILRSWVAGGVLASVSGILLPARVGQALQSPSAQLHGIPHACNSSRSSSRVTADVWSVGLPTDVWSVCDWREQALVRKLPRSKHW